MLTQIFQRIRQKILFEKESWIRQNTLNDIAKRLSVATIQTVCSRALEYIETLRVRDSAYGRYRYTADSQNPILYASIFAVLSRHLLNDLATLPQNQQEEWGEYIASHQCEDGLFRDPFVTNDIAEKEDWWGWRHVTVLALMALRALNTQPRHALGFLEPVASSTKMRSWLSRLDWGTQVGFTSNAVQNYGAALQYARDFMDEPGLHAACDTLFEEVSALCNSDTGLWGAGFPDALTALLDGVVAGYHFWVLYWYDGLDIPFGERTFHSITHIQNRFGGFHPKEVNSSACHDIDGVLPLIRLSYRYPHLQPAALPVVKKAIPWLLYNFNSDGGACFMRNRSFCYGHPAMFSNTDQSAIFPTWFRLLTITECVEFLKMFCPEYAVVKFSYLQCPGLQFSPHHHVDGGGGCPENHS